MLSALSELVARTSELLYNRFPTFVGEYWYGKGVELNEDHVEFIDELCLAGLHPTFVHERLNDMGTLLHIYRVGWAYATNLMSRLDTMTADIVTATFRPELASWIQDRLDEGTPSEEVHRRYCTALLDLACCNASWSEGEAPATFPGADCLGTVSGETDTFPVQVACCEVVRELVSGSSMSLDGELSDVKRASRALTDVGVWFHVCPSPTLDALQCPSEYICRRRDQLVELIRAEWAFTYRNDFGDDPGLHLSPPWQATVALDGIPSRYRTETRRIVALFHLDQSKLDFRVLDAHTRRSIAFADLQLQPRSVGSPSTAFWTDLVVDSRRERRRTDGTAATADAAQAIYGAQSQDYRESSGRPPAIRTSGDGEVVEQLVLKRSIGTAADSTFLGYFELT
jgi:hypothetical protein